MILFYGNSLKLVPDFGWRWINFLCQDTFNLGTWRCARIIPRGNEEMSNLMSSTPSFSFGAICISEFGDCTRWCNYPFFNYAGATALLGTVNRGMKWKVNPVWLPMHESIKEGWLKVRTVIFRDSRFVGSNNFKLQPYDFTGRGHHLFILWLCFSWIIVRFFFILSRFSFWVGKVIPMWRLKCIFQSVLRMYVPMNHPSSGDALFSKVDSSQPVQATVWLGSSCDDKVTIRSSLANYKW